MSDEPKLWLTEQTAEEALIESAFLPAETIVVTLRFHGPITTLETAQAAARDALMAACRATLAAGRHDSWTVHMQRAQVEEGS